jgi:hypothetical protein
MDPTLECVYTVDDWYDGAREGAADYGGHPHAYRSLYIDFDEWNPDEDRFELTPIPTSVLSWFLERAQLFRRWDAERKAGRIASPAEDATPALPDDCPRYEELGRLIAEALENAGSRFTAHGVLEYGPQYGPSRAAVRWQPSPFSANAAPRESDG